MYQLSVPPSLPPTLPPSLPTYLIGTKAVDLSVGEDGYQLLHGGELQLHELRQPHTFVIAMHHHIKLEEVRKEGKEGERDKTR